MKKLTRKNARLIILLLVFIAAMCPMMYVMDYVLGVPKSVLTVIAWLIIGLAVATPFIWMQLLKCPHCRQGFAPLSWNPGKKRCCADCGKLFVFDDEPDPEQEEERSLFS